MPNPDRGVRRPRHGKTRPKFEDVVTLGTQRSRSPLHDLQDQMGSRDGVFSGLGNEHIYGSLLIAII